MERILVINPNSTQAVTDGIDRAMEPLRMSGGPSIECVTLKEGPPGIETQAHVESVVAPISAAVKSRDNDCSAFVIAWLTPEMIETSPGGSDQSSESVPVR